MIGQKLTVTQIRSIKKKSGALTFKSPHNKKDQKKKIRGQDGIAVILVWCKYCQNPFRSSQVLLAIHCNGGSGGKPEQMATTEGCQGKHVSFVAVSTTYVIV
jgi:hypothetical protein